MNYIRIHVQPSSRLTRLVSAPLSKSLCIPSSQRLFANYAARTNEVSENVEPSTPNPTTMQPKLDIDAYLSKPSWSVKSLLPTLEQLSEQSSVSPQQLRHLLRLSALPQPKDAEEEAKMLETLSSQLFFVQEIQKLDTTDVTPLSALNDERPAAKKANEITLETLKEALEQEEVVGEHHKRIRRKQGRPSPADNLEGWNPLEHTRRKVGKFFVVDSGPTPTI